MKVLKSWPLAAGFTLAKVDEINKEVQAELAQKYLFSEYPILNSRLGLSDPEKRKLQNLKKNLKDKYELCLVILRGKEIVGWTHGWQDSIEQDSFFMASSVVIPELRGRGFYSKMTKKLFELTKEQGFQSVWSLHTMTNNPILIAKLKLGFSIFGFEVNTRYGALVRLIYHHSEFKQKAIRYRAGAVAEEEVVKALLK